MMINDVRTAGPINHHCLHVINIIDAHEMDFHITSQSTGEVVCTETARWFCVIRSVCGNIAG